MLSLLPTLASLNNRTTRVLHRGTDVPLPMMGRKTKPTDCQSCQHRRLPASIQATSFFLWDHVSRIKDLKPPQSDGLFNLGQHGNAWDAGVPGGQAETTPFLSVQNEFLAPFDPHRSSSSSSLAVAIWEFAVLPFHKLFRSDINGDILRKEDATWKQRSH